MNNCTFIGRMVSDPVLNKTPDGVSVCNFVLAISRDFKKDGVKKEFVDYLPFEIWDTAAEVVSKGFRKGNWIVVYASAKSYKSEDNKTMVNFRVNKFEFPSWFDNSRTNSDNNERE